MRIIQMRTYRSFLSRRGSLRLRTLPVEDVSSSDRVVMAVLAAAAEWRVLRLRGWTASLRG